MIFFYNPNKLIYYVLNRLQNGNLVNLSPCKQKRDFIYIDDVVDATIKSLETQYVNTSYNIGSNERYSINELVRKMMKNENKLVNIDYQDADETHNTIRFNNSTKALDDGILKLTTDLNKGLKLTVDWIKSQ